MALPETEFSKKLVELNRICRETLDAAAHSLWFQRIKIEDLERVQVELGYLIGDLKDG